MDHIEGVHAQVDQEDPIHEPTQHTDTAHDSEEEFEGFEDEEQVEELEEEADGASHATRKTRLGLGIVAVAALAVVGGAGYALFGGSSQIDRSELAPAQDNPATLALRAKIAEDRAAANRRQMAEAEPSDKQIGKVPTGSRDTIADARHLDENRKPIGGQSASPGPTTAAATERTDPSASVPRQPNVEESTTRDAASNGPGSAPSQAAASPHSISQDRLPGPDEAVRLREIQAAAGRTPDIGQIVASVAGHMPNPLAPPEASTPAPPKPTATSEAVIAGATLISASQYGFTVKIDGKLRDFRMNDTIPGIGRATAIEQWAGGWEIATDTGAIRPAAASTRQ